MTGRGGYRALAAGLAAVFIGALDLTVIATILPEMVSDLGVNTADIDRYIWIVNGYLLAYITAIPIVGRISDLVGRQAAFQVALAIFVAGSIWCAASDTLVGIVAGRVVQGAGAGALLPITMALVGDVLPRERRTAALGVVGAVDTLGWVLGPLWGAAVVAVGGGSDAWRWVFAVNVPLGIGAMLLLVRKSALSEDAGTHPVHRRGLGHLDLPGSLLLAGTLLLLNLGLSSGGEVSAGTESGLRALGGTSNPLAPYLPWLLGGAVVLGAGLFWWERRAAVPALPPALFAERRFSAAMAANILVGGALIVGMVNVPVVVALLVAEDRVSAVSALMLAPFTLLMATLSFAGGRLAGRIGQRWTAAIGLALVAIGYLVLWRELRGNDYQAMWPGLVIAGGGFGLVIAPIGVTALNAAAAADRGIAAGLTLVFRLLGMTIGISALTAIGVRRLQTLTDRLETVVRGPNETTAEFLLRQTQFIEERVLPLAIQVVRETFLVAAVLALLALAPVMFIED